MLVWSWKLLHDFSQAETGWFSPFVTMSLHPGAVFRLQRAQLLSVRWGHCPLLSTCTALLASGWSWLCPLQHSSHHAGCSPPAVLLPWQCLTPAWWEQGWRQPPGTAGLQAPCSWSWCWRGSAGGTWVLAGGLVLGEAWLAAAFISLSLLSYYSLTVLCYCFRRVSQLLSELCLFSFHKSKPKCFLRWTWKLCISPK